MNKQCIFATQVCDFVSQCSDGSDETNCGPCTFESGLCGWVDVSTSRYQWEKHSGSTHSAISGPSTDHTLKTPAGFYMYVDSGKGAFFGHAIMQSPVFGQLSASCQVNFWYHKKSAGGVMRLFLIPPGIRTNAVSGRILLWSAFGAHGSQWNNASAGVGARMPGYRLLFEALHVLRSGDMAIDDITMSQCGLTNNATVCAANQFHCTRGACVDNSKVCDFQDDCGDSSDELNCGRYVERCNFETSMCNWIQDKTDDFDWTRVRGRTMTVGTGPDRDHTTGNETGYYIYIETSAPRRPNDSARIKSIVFRPTTSGVCRMRLFYHMFGPHVNALKIYKEVSNTGARNVIWSKLNSQADAWKRADILITSSVNFRIVIEGIRGSGYKGDIGIDDISFTPGCQIASGATLSPFPPTTPGPCGPGKGQCANKQCIPADAFCNFKNDCTDGSDELSCPSKCNFENGNMCRWTNQMKGQTSNWTVASNGQPTKNSGPTLDHTTGKSSGHYGLIKNPGNFFLENSRLVSPIYHRAGQSCSFSFWYAMGRLSFRPFKLFIRKSETESTLWTQPRPPRPFNSWNIVSVQLPVCSSDFQLIFEADAFTSKSAYVAIDDLVFTNCSQPDAPPSCSLGQLRCADGHCIARNLQCDFQTDCCDGTDEAQQNCYQYSQCNFELGMCGWVQDTTDNFNWTWFRGRTGSSDTGPIQDHTSGSASGYYLYIESSSPRVPNDTARIIYNMPKPPGKCSLRFWYHMYGTHIGALNVYSKTLDRGQNLLASVKGQQGNKWIRKEVSLLSSTPFQTIIEGVIGVGYRGDIAIDDISFTPGCGMGSVTPPPLFSPGAASHQSIVTTRNPCPTGQRACADGTCMSSKLFCDFKRDCRDGSDESSCPTYCSFEKGMCGWKNTVPDLVDWERATGISTNNLGPMAPPFDASRGKSQYFVFIHDKTPGGHVGGQVATLASPQFSAASSDCKVRFKYFMHGISPAGLSLVIKQGTQSTILWQDRGDHGSAWLATTVGIGRRFAAFQLTFKMLYARIYKGAIAIDEIQFENCGIPPVQKSCTADQFRCTRGACVPKSSLCDNIDDCGDKSDETDSSCQNYKKYNFEQGIGDLKQGQNKVDDDFDWKRWAGKTPSSGSGPDRDHTIGTPSGHYMYMEASAPAKYNQKTWLLTKPFYASASKNCNMRFFFFMYGKHVNQLNVYYRLYNSGPPTHLIWSVAGNQGSYWQSGIVRLNVSSNFQVIIEARVGDSYLGDIAIDDLSFTPDCQFSPALPSPPAGVSQSTQMPTSAAPHQCNLTAQFNCRSDGKCVSRKKVCDFNQDCADGTDENNCVQPICDFERGNVCGWKLNSTEMAYSWKVDQPIRTSSTDMRPITDHTQLSVGHGWYLWADSSKGSRQDFAVVSTPTIGQTGPQCKLSLWYIMNGTGVGSFEVYTKYGGNLQSLWIASGNHGPSWRHVEIMIGPDSNFKILLEARRGPSYRGDIAIDDVKFVNCQPPMVIAAGCSRSQFTCSNQYCIDPNKQCDFADDCGDNSDEMITVCKASYPGRCDFEPTFCGSSWQQEINDDFDWILHSGTTPTPGTGPSIDHTTLSRTGHYMYIEASTSRRKPGDVARLASFVIKGSAQNCHLRLWYHMFGSTIGVLSVWKRFDYTAQGLALVKQIKGMQDDFWYRLDADLTSSGGDTRDFMAIIQASRGSGIYGDIAIDDVSLTPGCEKGGSLPGQPTAPVTTPSPCGAGLFMCANKKCFSQNERCNFYDDCGDNTDETNCGTSCTFESGMCGWQNSKNDVLDWSTRAGKTPSRNTGPSADHTFGNTTGHYVYVESSGSAAHLGHTAVLETAKYQVSGANCNLTFWYHMYGKTMGTLQVMIKTEQDGHMTRWTTSGNQGNTWHQATVRIGSRRNFGVMFVALMGTSYTADVAIDDVQFTNCAVGTKAVVCPADEFLCRDGMKCIQRRYLCDHRKDCDDNSDENTQMCVGYLGDCSFDNPAGVSYCGWSQSNNDDANWIQAATDPNTGTGPKLDHSMKPKGQFVYVDSSKMSIGQIARIVSPKFPASSGVCYMRFYYYMTGSPDIGPLRVYTKNKQNQLQLMWTVSGNHPANWIYVNIPLGNNLNFTVIIEATRGTGKLADIAIDDVTFTRQCQTGKPYIPSTELVCGIHQIKCAPLSQCLPKTWQCDGVSDCPDNSDEPSSCPTTTAPQNPATGPPVTHKPKTLPPQTPPPTPPSQQCPSGQFVCDKVCKNAIFLCDGVQDCDDGTDENRCSVCAKGSYYCTSSQSCIMLSSRCNGVVECTLGHHDMKGQDEASCGKCPANYCQNSGQCVASANKIPVCKCTNSWTGTRCQTSKTATVSAPPPTQAASTGSNNKKWAIPVGIILVLLVLGGVAAGLFVYRRRRIQRQLLFDTSSSPMGLSNPVYDYGSDGADGGYQMNELEPPTFHDNFESGTMTIDATSIENPLYSEAFSDA
ncbi:MAM and LDL-receptor class A domain-containing protein 2-like [Gigantopelta aegis]|uniref:MAM and LDL-receptor class A domain-containing protein 2-like n=1 Tax=Gigantopelta aegis TaxID=1735272 RepID=UPI001B8897AF|nr:MAM and LDL-receptor class A domain-containing protein 2-like [Gigantopelta aegis]